ncbi:T9SS type A sorting domain-containing protein, partial [Aureisphaera sp.]
FSVPAGASPGPTRMRVSMKYNGIPTSCESFQWGEVEDYIVVIPTSFQSTGDTPQAISLSTQELFLYPNPVRGGYLNIAIKGGSAREYTIYNVVGQLVASGTIQKAIDVSQLQSGMYLLQVTIDGQNIVKNFLVE